MDMVVDVCKKENISIDKESIEKIISLSNGAARDCLTMLDQMNLNTNSNITAVDIDNVFGLVDDNNKIKLLNFIKQNNAQCIIDMTKSFDEIGVNFSLLTNSLITIILDKIIMFATNNHDILKTNIQLLNSFDYSKEECLKVINELQTLSINLKNCHSPKTYFEICILNCFNIFSDFDNDLKVNAINSNLDLNTIQQPIINTIQQPIINNIHKDFYKVTKIIHKYPDTNIDTSLSIEIPQINTTTSNNNVISLNTQIQKIIIDPLSLFKMIANNYSKAHMIEAKNLINTIKNSYNLNKLNYISSNKEVLVASENGIVLLFENETDAELLNNNAIQKDFLLELSKFINHPKYIIGFSFEQKDTIVKEFEKTINEKTPEPDISQLEEVLNSINITNDIDDFFV
ncbi:hypothetical protein FACS189459_4530 [Bacilli bacterium]|nr:hypothetical protein FACS189459_4530 [Bacilli bacterium]